LNNQNLSDVERTRIKKIAGKAQGQVLNLRKRLIEGGVSHFEFYNEVPLELWRIFQTLQILNDILEDS